MSYKRCVGVTPAAVTIWNNDQSYNPKGMEQYLTWLLDNGAESISVCGTGGEHIAMTSDEMKQVIEHTVSFIDGAVPVYAGCGRYSTMHTIDLCQHAKQCGADGALIILPYYMTPHKRAVMNHFREIKATVDIPIMLYNNPWFAGYEMTTQEIKTLYEEGVITSVKAAHGDPARVHELKYHCGENFNVMYGHDYGALEALLVGADGWLSGLPSILPKQCRELWDACHEKNIDKAIQKQYKLQPFLDYLIYDKVNGEPHFEEIFKYTLTAQGLDAGLPRRPVGELDDVNKKKIDKLLADL